MATETGYQGWTNYETWAVALWIDNEEPLYRESRDMARTAIADAEEDDGDKGARRGVYDLAQKLKEWIEEMAPELGASLWSDLLNGALSEVNWREIAEAYIAEVKE